MSPKSTARLDAIRSTSNRSCATRNEGLYGKTKASPIVNEFSLNNSNCLFIQILKRSSLSRFKIYTERLPELSFRLWYFRSPLEENKLKNAWNTVFCSKLIKIELCPIYDRICGVNSVNETRTNSKWPKGTIRVPRQIHQSMIHYLEVLQRANKVYDILRRRRCVFKFHPGVSRFRSSIQDDLGCDSDSRSRLSRLLAPTSPLIWAIQELLFVWSQVLAGQDFSDHGRRRQSFQWPMDVSWSTASDGELRLLVVDRDCPPYMQSPASTYSITVCQWYGLSRSFSFLPLYKLKVNRSIIEKEKTRGLWPRIRIQFGGEIQVDGKTIRIQGGQEFRQKSSFLEIFPEQPFWLVAGPILCWRESD